MDIMYICRDALASSFVTALLMAIEARKADKKVAVLFTQEALAAMVGKTSFSWPRGLSGQELRYNMVDNGLNFSLPISGKRQGRQLDPRGMLDRAIESDVTIYACPVWIKLLGADTELPKGIQTPNVQQSISLLESAKLVIGSY